ncbi:sulfotransferase [Lysobacter niabensis]|uniref:tetratricopeptide repeat-containing sulfotransferase family protein n=1 Tax=Agrilutibacter niabensis TaxID=380628 RepID=UPI00361462D8
MAVSTREQGDRYASAVAALNAGDWKQAQHLAMYLLREMPQHAGVSFVAGVAAMQLQQMPLAAACLQRAVQLNPARADYAAQFARSLAQSSRTREAGRMAEMALSLSPTDALTLDTLGVVFNQANDYERAAQMFKRVSELEPGRASYRFNYATSLVFAGDVEQAERELEACLAIDPRYWKAYLTLAQLRKATRGSNLVARIEAMLANAGGNKEAEMFLHLALAKEQEDLAEYGQAFASLVRGKTARAPQKYEFSRDDALFDAIEHGFGGAEPAESGCPGSGPIFVFGMPRSGTTLVERILSSHPQVETAGELQDFGVALKRASGSRTPELLDVDTMTRAGKVDWRSLGEAYLASTRQRAGAALHFVDKLPHNFLYAGFIANALPAARLICVRRDPVDTCLSNFKQLFSLDSPYYDYSFDLLDTGRYYLRFDRLMAYWKQRLPGRILEIQYEDVVANQEASTRQLLDFCGLEWDEACLRFEENASRVATASAVQVRSPIYRSAVQRWRHYEAHLEDLLQLLESGGVHCERKTGR